CCRRPTTGMDVHATSERALKSQRMVVELLLSDMPAHPHDPESELAAWAKALGLEEARFASRAQPEPDFSHAGIEVRLDACIQCTRCVRACREVQVNDVIGYAHRGADAKIVFDLDDPMGSSTCVACGECVQACPTGALLPAVSRWIREELPAPLAPADTSSPAGDGAATGPDEGRALPDEGRALPIAGWVKADRQVDTLCPYCGVGCQTELHVRDNRVLTVEGRNGPSNLKRLCVKGRFGFDYVHHPQRL